MSREIFIRITKQRVCEGPDFLEVTTVLSQRNEFSRVALTAEAE